MPQQAKKPYPLSPRSQESSYEFVRTSKASRLICNAFFKFLQSVKDPKQNKRLTSKLYEIIQTDTIHGRGERTVGAGDVSLLEGFDFCMTQQLHRLLLTPVTGTIDRATGICTIAAAPFTPARDMCITGNVTHVQFFAAAGELDFGRERFVTNVQQTEALPLNESIHLILAPTVPKDSRKTILVALGIRLLQVVNGQVYEMSGTRAAFHVVKAEGEVYSGEPGVLSSEAGVRSIASKPKSGTGSLRPEVRSRKSERPKGGQQKRVTAKQGKASTSRKASGKSKSAGLHSIVKLTGRRSKLLSQ